MSFSILMIVSKGESLFCSFKFCFFDIISVDSSLNFGKISINLSQCCITLEESFKTILLLLVAFFKLFKNSIYGKIFFFFFFFIGSFIMFLIISLVSFDLQ